VGREFEPRFVVAGTSACCNAKTHRADGKTRRGLEADQKVIAAHGCYAMTATTALTAQNTQGVFGIHETPTAFVEQQIKAVVEDVGVDVVKTGIFMS